MKLLKMFASQKKALVSLHCCVIYNGIEYQILRYLLVIDY